jgi:NDP-sugar pyrophosphorylase family protein
MKAVILAGGLGQRLRAAIGELPKPMAPVAGKPFLEFLVMQLRRWNIRDIVISTGYKATAIKGYFRNGRSFGVHISYCHEAAPLGTGGALKKAAQRIDDEYFLVLNGDSYLDFNFRDMLTFHILQSAMATIGLTWSKDTRRFGRVELNAERQVIQFIEKSDTIPGYINGGVYICRSDLVDTIPSGNVSLEMDVLPSLAGRGLYGLPAGEIFADIGTPTSYRNVCRNPLALFDIAGLPYKTMKTNEGMPHGKRHQ